MALAFGSVFSFVKGYGRRNETKLQYARLLRSCMLAADVYVLAREPLLPNQILAEATGEVIDRYVEPRFAKAINEIAPVSAHMIKLPVYALSFGGRGDVRVLERSVPDNRYGNEGPPTWFKHPGHFTHTPPVVRNMFEHVATKDHIERIVRVVDIRDVQFDHEVGRASCRGRV